LPSDPAKLPQPSVTTTMAVIGVGLPQAIGLKKLRGDEVTVSAGVRSPFDTLRTTAV
jgi:hypothetical protein